MITTLLILSAFLAAGAELDRKRGSSMGYYSTGADAVAIRPLIAYRKQYVPVFSVSPIEGVSAAKWTAFAKAMRVSAWSAIADNGALGAFKLSYPALAALGLVSNARREGGKWVATWAVGRSEATFLADRGLQYRAFSALAVRNVQLARVSFAPFIGAPTPHGDISLSGLLAILMVAGRKGLAGWLKKPVDRVRFPNTTEAFKRGNGAF